MGISKQDLAGFQVAMRIITDASFRDALATGDTSLLYSMAAWNELQNIPNAEDKIIDAAKDLLKPSRKPSELPDWVVDKFKLNVGTINSIWDVLPVEPPIPD